MGHWAQNRRRGSTPPGGLTPLISIVSVADAGVGSGLLDVVFSAAVAAGSFTPGLFVDDTLGAAALTVIQNGVNILRYGNVVDWLGNDQGGDAWSFSDVVVGVATPQNGLVV